MVKRCSCCKEEKSLLEFHKDKTGKFGVMAICKNCRKIPLFKRKIVLPEGFKICSKCGKEKELSEFHKDKRGKFGVHSRCIDCYKIYCKINKDNIRKKNQRYAKENKVIIQEKAKRYREEHQEEFKIYRLSRKQQIHDYYEKNKEKWVISRESRKEQINKREKERLKTDVNYKIRRLLKDRIYGSLKGLNKSENTVNLLGCSLEFCKQYIENQFKDGMTWDNWGRGLGDKGMQEWHIDHIQPCIMFDLSKPEQQAQCFHYTNLRPLWAKENISRQKYF